MKIKCPNCRAEVRLDGNAWRPFCSERCKMADLGAWVTGEYGISGESDEDAVSAQETPRGKDGFLQ